MTKAITLTPCTPGATLSRTQLRPCLSHQQYPQYATTNPQITNICIMVLHEHVDHQMRHDWMAKQIQPMTEQL